MLFKYILITVMLSFQRLIPTTGRALAAAVSTTTRQIQKSALTSRAFIAVSRLSASRFPPTSSPLAVRFFSSNDSTSSSSFAPDKLTADMAQGIADATHFYIRHGQATNLRRVFDVSKPWLKNTKMTMALPSSDNGKR